MNNIRITNFGISFPICYGIIPDIGMIITGNPKTIDSGLPNSGIGDIVLSVMYGPAVLITGNSTQIDSGKPVSRLFDIYLGCHIGFVITGNSSTNIG